MLFRSVSQSRYLQLGGLEGLDDELVDVGRPAEEVDLLVVELADDVFHTGPADADAGTDGVDFFHVRPDGDLGAETGLAGEGLDLDNAIGELGHLEGEKAADKILAGAGEDDLGAALALLDGEDKAGFKGLRISGSIRSMNRIPWRWSTSC